MRVPKASSLFLVFALAVVAILPCIAFGAPDPEAKADHEGYTDPSMVMPVSRALKPKPKVKRVAAAEDPRTRWVFLKAREYWIRQGVVVPEFVISAERPDAGNTADVRERPDGVQELRIDPGLNDSFYRAGVALLALHETVHVAQFAHPDFGPSYRADAGWYEGMAEALAYDHLCSFMAFAWSEASPATRKAVRGECVSEVTVSYDPFLSASGDPYVRYMREFRMVSARLSGAYHRSPLARAYRLELLKQSQGTVKRTSEVEG